jgi:hypothetical protein
VTKLTYKMFIGSIYTETLQCLVDVPYIDSYKGKFVAALLFNYAPCRESVLEEWRYSYTHSLTNIPTFRHQPTHLQWRTHVYPEGSVCEFVVRRFYSDTATNIAISFHYSSYSITSSKYPPTHTYTYTHVRKHFCCIRLFFIN